VEEDVGIENDANMRLLRGSCWNALKHDDPAGLMKALTDHGEEPITLLVRLELGMWKGWRGKHKSERYGLLAIAAANVAGLPKDGAVRCLEFLLATFPDAWSEEQLEKAAIGAVSRKRKEAVQIIERQCGEHVFECKSCDPEKYQPHMCFLLGKLQQCHLNWKKDQSAELIITPKQHISEFWMMEEEAARAFWVEVQECVDKLMPAQCYPVLLSISCGSWNSDTHACIHVTCEDDDKQCHKFEAVLHGLQAAEDHPQCAGKILVASHTDGRASDAITCLEETAALEFDPILKKSKVCFESLEVEGYCMQLLLSMPPSQLDEISIRIRTGKGSTAKPGKLQEWWGVSR